VARGRRQRGAGRPQLAGKEWPFFERGAPAFVVEHDDPQVSVGRRGRIAVMHLDPGDTGGAFDGHDF
jgi:hypothetical protein